MKKTEIIALFVFAFIFCSLLASAQNTTVKYFYGEGCTHCAKVEASGILEEIQKLGINVEKYEIYRNNSNRELFYNLTTELGIESYQRGVPLAIIICNDKKTYLSGDSPIINNLKDKCLNFSISTEEVSPHNITKNQRTILAVIFAALADGIINPCAIGVLAFLLIVMSSITSKKRLIEVVLTYIITIYIVYFFSGLGLFSAIQSLKITSLMYNAASILLILAGIINIKDFFFYGKGITLGIPKSKKPLIERYIHKATIPSTIILGFLVAIFELPCTGAWYLSILTMLANSMTQLKAIPLLLLYNFLFILPLIVISLIVILGMPPEKVQLWTENKKKMLRLITGVIMLTLGVLMLIPGIF